VIAVRRRKPAWAAQVPPAEPEATPGMCPHCGQPLPRRYWRSLGPRMAAMVLRLAALTKPGGAPVHLNALGISMAGGDYARLPLWDLAEKVLTEGATRGSGKWRITHAGLRFALGETLQPRRLAVEAGKVVARSEELVTAVDVLGRDKRKRWTVKHLSREGTPSPGGK